MTSIMSKFFLSVVTLLLGTAAYTQIYQAQYDFSNQQESTDPGSQLRQNGITCRSKDRDCILEYYRHLCAGRDARCWGQLQNLTPACSPQDVDCLQEEMFPPGGSSGPTMNEPR